MLQRSDSRHGVYSSADLTLSLPDTMTADDQSPEMLKSETEDTIPLSPNSAQQRQKRFIDSIIQNQKDEFHRLLPLINLEDKVECWTPLIWAIEKDQQWAIEEFFKNTQLIDFKNHMFRGRTVLHFAAEKGDCHLFQLLLSRNSKQSMSTLDVNAVDRDHCTALFCAAKVGDADIVHLLLQSGADPNITNRDAISALLVAAHRGHIEVVQRLLNCPQIDVNQTDERGRSALIISCAENRRECVKLLLKCKGIDLNAKDKQNFDWNCLMWSVYRKNEKIINMLLRHDKWCDLDYFHLDLYDTNALDMARTAKLKSKSIQRVKSKFYSSLFPVLLYSELILDLKVPTVVVGILMAYTY